MNRTSENQAPKRHQQFEESTPKRPKTGQTDIPNSPSAHPGTETHASDEHQAQSQDASGHSSSLDIPPPAAETVPQTIPLVSAIVPPQQAFSTIRPGSNIANVPFIRTAKNALAVVNALQPEDLTNHADMPFALIAQILKVADGDTVLLSMLATRILTLATTEHAMACVLASFLEASRPGLPAASIQALVKRIGEFAGERQDLLSPVEQYLPLLQQLADSAAEADGNLDADAEMPTVAMQHGVNATGTAPTDGDVPPSNIGVPAGTLVIPLPMPPQPVMPAHQIINVNPNAWDPAWTSKVFTLLVPHVNPLGVESPATLRGSAKPMADLARVSKAMRTQFTGRLAALRWTHQLTLYNFDLNPDPLSDAVASSIDVLVDRAAYRPDLPQARAQHTLALMLAARESLRELYAQLHARAASGADLAPHIDWEQLPVHAILVEYLALGPAADEFQALVEEVLDTLPTFSDEVQAQVCADLCAPFFDPAYRQMLSRFGTPESKVQLERLKHFEAAAAACSTKTLIDQVHVAPLLEALPPAGDPWNLSALFALRLLTQLHKAKMLTFEQVQALIDKGVEMLRHFMSLARPGAADHPLIDAAQFLSTHLELEAAFMQLSPHEKVKLLKIYPIEQALALVDDLVQGSSLSLPEKLRLIEDILGQLGVPIELGTMLRHRIGYLLRQADRL